MCKMKEKQKRFPVVLAEVDLSVLIVNAVDLRGQFRDWTNPLSR